MAELQFPNIVGGFLQAQQLGQRDAQAREVKATRSRIGELASMAYGAAPDQRQAIIGQAVGVDPEAGLALSKGLSADDDAREKRLLATAQLISAAPEDQKAAIYAQARPQIAQYLPNLPDAYSPQVGEGIKAFIASRSNGGRDVKVVGNSLVDSAGNVLYQAPQRFQTDSGLIEVGPQGAREITLGGPAQVGPIGDVQAGTGFSIGADVPPEVAAQIQAQESAQGGIQSGPAPGVQGNGQRILPRGAGMEAQRFQLAMDANRRATEAAALANEAAERSRQEADQRQRFGTIPAGFRVNAAGTALEAVPGGPKPAGAAASEDERKAAGWFNQASRARQNIAEVLRDNPGADLPETYEAYGFRGDPEGGPIDRYLAASHQSSISPGRQRYNQAISSFGEAVLRAATGAGVNRDEAAQKVRELTPVPGDSKEVRDQKLAGLDGYLNDLQTRAGRALTPQQGQPTGTPPTTAPRARNPQTGQVIELRNGQWVPVNG